MGSEYFHNPRESQVDMSAMEVNAVKPNTTLNSITATRTGCIYGSMPARK